MAHTLSHRDDRRRPDRPQEPASVEGRLPPHSLETEAAVLAASMLDPESLERTLHILRPGDFYAESHKRIFEAILEVRATGQRVDTVLVAEELRNRGRIEQVGGFEGLAKIIGNTAAITAANAEAYARAVQEKARVRQMILLCQSYAAHGYIDYGDASEFLSQLSADAERIASSTAGGIAFEGADLIMREDNADDETKFLVPQLQLGPGRCTMLAGDSYTGKSVIAGDIAVGVNTGVDVFGLMRVVERGPVRWLNYDQDPKLARRRLRRIARARGVQLGVEHRFEIGHFPELHLDDDDAELVLARIARGFKLCIIDALIGSVIRTQERDEAIGRVLLKLMHASHRTGCTFLVIHHTVKPQGEFLGADGKPMKKRPTSQPASAAIRGNRAIFGSCDSVLLLESTGKKKPVRVVHEKAPQDGNTLDDFYLQFRDVEKPEPFELDPDVQEAHARARRARPASFAKWGLEVVHLEPEQAESPSERKDPVAEAKEGDRQRRAAFEQLMERIVETIKTYPGLSGRALKKLLDKVPKDQIDAALSTLKDRKAIVAETGPRNSLLWRAN